MKLISLISILAITISTATAQSEGIQPLQPFTKIVASQYVNVVLEKGDTESIRLTYSGVNPDEVNVVVRRHKLHIYLNDAKFVEKRDRYNVNGYAYRKSRYQGTSITAYVTYKELRSLEIRGEEELVCNSDLGGDKFKLKAYGETEINLASVNARKFKASLFGENKMKINTGEAGHQTYRLYGDNNIDAQQVKSNTISSRIYGEGILKISANDELRLTALGEPQIMLDGGAHINKQIVLGEPEIRVRR